MQKYKYDMYFMDTETVVYKGQEETAVWANGIVGLFNDFYALHHSLDETYQWITTLKRNILIYYHNLKFDGSFWLHLLINKLGYNQGTYYDDLGHLKFYKEKELSENMVVYSISDRGMWYRIVFKLNGHIVELRDSLKLLPFSVKVIGESFCKNRRKLDMEYQGKRYPGCKITKKEEKYIKNDLLIPKEALEKMFEDGHTKLTIGSCCLSEFKKIMKDDFFEFDNILPDLTKEIAPPYTLYQTADEYIRREYRGGWTYLKKGCEGKVYYDGVTADVNSEYPFVMHSSSGNYYPTGRPRWWQGNFIPDDCNRKDRFYYMRVLTRFYIKPGRLPFITLPGNFLYPPHTHLESSDFIDKNGVSHKFLISEKGDKKEMRVELVLTKMDYELLRSNYFLEDFEILDGCYFYAIKGLFDTYINKYKQIKETSLGASRTLAKLYLNNLYGKFGANTCSSFKTVRFVDDVMKFETHVEYEKKAGYIAIGAAITSYARYWVITHAQDNYDNFIYADTDSIHCNCGREDLKNIEVHKTELGKWDIEKEWDRAIFVRQKTYIEHDDDGYEIKCAGMPDKCKWLLRKCLGEDGVKIEYLDNYNWITKEGEKKAKLEDEYEIDFTLQDMKLEDFKIGLEVPGKLASKQIKGGVVLQPTTFKITPRAKF